MKALILAGGQGTRLWPLSRTRFPKQFLKIGGEASLLQKTVRRLLDVVTPNDVVILSNADYQFHVRADLGELLGPALSTNLILEPAPRNTAPALALAALFCIERLGCSRDEVLFIAPSDHVIADTHAFAGVMRRAAEIASLGHIVTFGIEPTSPNTGYGYIQAGESLGTDYSRVARFTEKPDAATAQSFLDQGGFYWNSGMFAFPAGLLLDEITAFTPEIATALAGGYERALAGFAAMPNISIDYAVMERSTRVVTYPTTMPWSDVGSWDAFFDIMDADANGNVTVGDVVSLDTHSSLIIGDKRLISTIGVEDLLVVETADAILIARRSQAQEVKELVSKLRAAQRPELDEHVTTYRPWGCYTILGEGPRYKIKRVVVNPGEQLSLQMHHHRSEHWVVVRGTASVVVGDDEKTVHENESAYIPKSTRHRLGNPGRVPLEIIEVQNGEYVGEDDIVRFEDRYGR